MSTNIHRWPAQQRVRTGPVAESLPPEVADCTRVLLATTRSLAKSEIATATRQALGAKLVAEHATMRAHSPVEDVLALAALLRATGAERVVALGGGSASATGPVRTRCCAGQRWMFVLIRLSLPRPSPPAPRRGSPGR